MIAKMPKPSSIAKAAMSSQKSATKENKRTKVPDNVFDGQDSEDDTLDAPNVNLTEEELRWIFAALVPIAQDRLICISLISALT